MATMQDSWSETAWKRREDLAVPMFHKSHVPYSSSSNSLQHVDVWVPAKYTPDTDSLAALWLPPPETLWAIYIHGGAWRDPLVTSDAFTPALKNLSTAFLDSRKAPVAFASISYSLAAYPHHTTHPSDPSDDSRNATHPRHILDVLTGLSHLQQTAGFGGNYILAGHSCGATLAFQAALNPARSGVDMDKPYISPPLMVLGLNGLYDMPRVVRDPGDKHSQYCHLYEQFMITAFGHDEKVWKEISPAYVEDWAREWPAGRHVLLVQSREDSLVPFSQAEILKEALVKSKSAELGVVLVEGYGDHDDIWRKGSLFAEVLARAITITGL